MSREEYYEYHESREELAHGEALSSLPYECQICRHMTYSLMCDIESDYTEGCPKKDRMCGDCMYYDNGFCTENDEEVDAEQESCEEFDTEKE